MILKKIDDFTIKDIENLITNETCESKSLEYKKEFNIETGDERKEFLADISSFANAAGGIIIYGLSEDSTTKLPNKICGIPVKNEDELIRQIESLTRASISPRIPEMHFKLLALTNETGVLVIQISPSYLSPHRVIYKGYDKFYTRNSKGKYPMDVDELRQAFLLSDSLSKQIENYKLERLSTIAANRYNYLAEGYPVFIMQCIPISAFTSRDLHSIAEMKKALHAANATAFGISTKNQITIDGVMIHGKYITRLHNDYEVSAFSHYKTNGIIELATTKFFNPNAIIYNTAYKLLYRGELLEKTISSFNCIKDFYNRIEVTTPILLSCSIMNGEGFTMPSSETYEACGEIDRNALLISDILIDDLSIETETLLHPIFDSIWNACGFSTCTAYNNDGEYIGIE